MESYSHKKKLYLVLTLSILSMAAGTTTIPSIGITYSIPPISTAGYRHQTPPDPTPDKVAAYLERLKISAVRLHPDSNPAAIRAFSYSNISLLLTIPNPLIEPIAANRSNAAAWLYGHVVPFYPRARISAISVGSDVLESPTDLSDSLIPAIRNVHIALHELGIRKIAVSTTFSFIKIITTSFPPSAAEFQEPANEVIIKPLLQFLKETNSPFLINLHPYHVYRLNSEIPVGFALFQEHPFDFRDDHTTGVRYRNLYDMMVDALISAMAVAGHEDIPVIVAETGWPSMRSAAEEGDANQLYAEMYLRGLIKHLRSGIGTPLRKEGAVEVYVYELFDNVKGVKGVGMASGDWGVLYPNMTSKYNIDFGGASRVRGYGICSFWVLILYLVFWYGCLPVCFCS